MNSFLSRLLLSGASYATAGVAILGHAFGYDDWQYLAFLAIITGVWANEKD